MTIINKYKMIRKIGFLFGYFSILPVVMAALVLYSLYLLHESNDDFNRGIDGLRKNVIFSAIPEERAETQIFINKSDIRTKILEDFFLKNNSPLVAYASEIVEKADEYGLDYRLLPAIAMQESNLCKKMPVDSYNCWGFGIYGNKITRFSDYAEAIDTVSRTLARNYVEKGYVEPDQIMKKYTPSSNGSWAQGVAYFMNRLVVPYMD